MKTTLKMAERKRRLKVTGFAEGLGGFGQSLLARMDIAKGSELEIDPAYVSEIELKFNDKSLRLGYKSLMSIIVDERRLTDFEPGESGVISGLEVGRGELARFAALDLKEGTKVQVEKYIPGSGSLFIKVQGTHVAIVNVEGFIIAGDELYEYELPGDVVFVEVDGQERQLSSMQPREKGKISAIAANSELAAKLDRHWIKVGNKVKALHRKDPEGHALMVSVNGKRHHIPKGLTEKIYVKAV